MTEYGEIKEDNPEEKPPEKKIDCLKCRHLKITWEPKFPRACRILGFKGKELPSVTVQRATGKPCPFFTPVNKKK